MLDDLDAMRAALPREPRPKRRVAVKVDRIQISYWSQGEGRFKTRWTTCMFRPSPGGTLGR